MVRTGSKATALLLGRRRLCSSAVEQAAGSRRTELDFGTGSVELFARKHASVIGPRSLIICGGGRSNDAGHPQRVASLLRAAGVECSHWSMQDKYPRPQSVDSAVAMAKRIGAHSIVGVGGGAVIDMAKTVSAVAMERGGCREYMRVNYQEKEMKGETMPVVAIPTTLSAASSLSPQSLVLYEPEEALVPLNTPDVAPKVAVVDPELARTLPPDEQASMALSTLSVCLDGLLGQGVPHDARVLAKEGCRAVAEAMKQGGEVEDPHKRVQALSRAGVLAGQFLATWGPDAVPPIQYVCRYVAPLFPQASYTAIATALLHSYCQAVQDGTVLVNEALMKEVAEILVGRKEVGAAQLVEWVGQARGAGKAMLVLSSEGREERTAAAVAEQVSNVLDLFEVDRDSPALDTHVLHAVLARLILK